MRGYYLSPTDHSDRSGCRGGVAGRRGDNDYELEIGNQCNCSPEMMALLVHYDEVVEYLKLQKEDSSIAKIIYNHILETTGDLVREVAEKESRKRAREDEAPLLLDHIDLKAAADEMKQESPLSLDIDGLDEDLHLDLHLSEG